MVQQPTTIDPHRLMALDHDQMVEALNKQSIISGIRGKARPVYLYKNRNFEFNRFPRIGFVLFRNGAERTAAMLNTNRDRKGMTSVKVSMSWHLLPLQLATSTT